MKRSNEPNDAVPMVRFAGFMWLAYLLALAAINISLGPPSHGPEFLYNIFYYACHIFIALVLLTLGYWKWIQKRLGSTFLPIVIVITTIMPILINWLVSGIFPLGPRFAPESPTIRLIPFLFLGIMLVAWQYKWQYTVFIISGITVLSLLVGWNNSSPGTPGFQGYLATTLIQTVIFLALGFSISYLMTRIRKQQESLENANIHLSHYASTLEQLTATRERNRLARELHDTLAHTLSGLSVQMETIKAYWDIDPSTARSLFEKALASAHSGLEETRRALKALRASPLDDMGLSLALETMVKDASARAGIPVEISLPEKFPVISPDVEQCVYRVAQEAITNAINHSRADRISVKIDEKEGKLILTVQDNGTGFDLPKINLDNHFGLQGMKERAELVGGQLEVNTAPGQGTLVRLVV